MKLFGRMVSFATWKKFIAASAGSAEMKRRVIDHIDKHVTKKNDDLIDCFMLGWMLGRFSTKLSAIELQDFETTILLTRDLNNVPIVQVNDDPRRTRG